MFRSVPLRSASLRSAPLRYRSAPLCSARFRSAPICSASLRSSALTAIAPLRSAPLRFVRSCRFHVGTSFIHVRNGSSATPIPPSFNAERVRCSFFFLLAVFGSSALNFGGWGVAEDPFRTWGIALLVMRGCFGLAFFPFGVEGFLRWRRIMRDACGRRRRWKNFDSKAWRRCLFTRSTARIFKARARII